MKLFAISCSVLLLGACASAVDGQTQNITLRTPGAENARCYLQNEDMKYIIETDQTLEIMKSPHDLTVTCLAAGNREKTITIKREINDWVAGNVVTGILPGAAYDYFSRGGFEYPSEIVVDFVGIPVTAYALPEYHNDDLGHNNYYNRIERIGPTQIITEENRYDVSEPLQKKVGLYGSEDESDSRSFDSMLNTIRNPAPSYDPSEEDK